MASIVQRDNSYSVVYYKKENGIRKQKWESFRTIKDALHRKSMVEYSQQSKKELAHRPQTVEQLIQEYVWLYGRAKWSLSMYTSTQGLIRNYINPYFGSVRLDELTHDWYLDFTWNFSKSRDIADHTTNMRGSLSRPVH